MKTSTLSSQEPDTKLSWYMELFGYLLGLGFTLKNKILKFNPGSSVKSSFFPFLNSALWLKILSIFSPAALILSVENTWTDIKNFYFAKNKTFSKSVALGVKVATTTASATFFGLAAFGSAALVLSVAPYLLLVATGLNAMYCLFNAGKHLYRAWHAPDKKTRNNHLWAAGKQALGVIINVLAFTVTFFLGLQVNSQLAKLGGGFIQDLAILKAVSGILKAATPIVYSLVACVTLGTIPSISKSAWDMNKATVQELKNFAKHPIASCKQAGKAIAAKLQNLWGFVKQTYYFALPILLIPIVLEATSLVMQTAFRITALLLTPCQWLIKKLNGDAPAATKTPAAVMPEAKTEPTLTNTSATTPALSYSVNGKTMATLKIDREELVAQIDAKITKMTHRPPTNKKDVAKLTLLLDLQHEFNKNQTITLALVEKLVAKAEKISPRLYQSFWRETGEVEEIIIAVKKFARQQVVAVDVNQVEAEDGVSRVAFRT